MINEIYVNDNLIISDNPKKQFRSGYKIRCIVCNELIERQWYDKKILEAPYECKRCVLKNRNPMHNPIIKKKHDSIIKSEEYRNNMRNLVSGDKNGFYGKSHSDDTVNIIKSKLNYYWENMNDKTRNEWSQRASKREKKRMKDNPIEYRRQKANAARVSHRSQFMNIKMNKIESIVYDYLKSLNITVDYSAILASYQYDFIIKGKRILIEVHGDYWHGNPKYYSINGSNDKRKLNQIQLSKQERDREKEKWAISRGFNLIKLWEDEINNGTFKNKLKDL
jgi:G:T-mismatch repair DNA endonuclease (very short patch repair protein)